MVDRAMEAFGRPDILVNNAGISAVAEAETMSPAQWQSVIDTTLSGWFHCAQSAERPMLRSGSGQITNLASAASGYMNGQALILDRGFLSC